ncbi:hypothetical protein D7O18_27495, partial [Salmonella enterica subsp. enterica serovar Muenchen]|nr:hypothetical protein [Salmonella enterica subsp. enterica serovar Muenchen]
MAVENKFRLNVIAASVLMGLSLSAVASTSLSSQGNDKEVVTPAPVKTLAEAVKDIAPSAVTFTQGSAEMNPSNAGDLETLLKYMANPVNTRD